MALTIVTSPEPLEPVFTNSMPFSVTSTLSSSLNFRYIFDVYTLDQINNASTFKTRVNPFPRPDNTGLYSPHYILRDNVSYKLQPYITTPTGNSQSLVHYQLKLGEEYNPGITWADTFYAFAPVAGELGLTFSTPHGLQVNDIILLNKTDKSLNPQYDGTASVVAVPDIWSIVTNKLFGFSSVLEGGEITDLLRMSATSSVLRGFNGCRQYDQVGMSFSFNYALNSLHPNGRWLTYFSGTKGLYSTDYQTLSYVGATNSASPDEIVYNFYNRVLGPLPYTTLSLTYSLSPNYKRVDIPTGPANLNNMGAIFVSAIQSNIQLNDNGYYTIQLKAATKIVSETFTYSFNKANDFGDIGAQVCNSPSRREYPLIEIAFLNSLGAFEYFTFNLVNRKTIKVNRKKYRKVLPYNYVIGDRGDTIFDEDITESMTIQSDWVNDAEALQIRELVSSPEVYIISQINNDGTTNLNPYPVIVTTDTYEIKNTLNDDLFNFTLTLDKAYTIFVNI